MPHFSYVACDARGRELRGTLEVSDQSTALTRLREMGFFPTRIIAAQARKQRDGAGPARIRWWQRELTTSGGTIKGKTLAVFTRQLATMLAAGMPLLRGLTLLHEQEQNRTMRRVISELIAAIEGGSSMSEALAEQPKVFNRLYVNLVKAGELGGALDVVLRRLAEFMEKARKIKGKVVTAMFYPTAVLTVAVVILGVLMVFVVPRFREVFAEMLNNRPLPAFTRFVLGLSEAVKNHILLAGIGVALAGFALQMFIRTRPGREYFDRLKLNLPLFGPVIKKVAIARFTRTLGTLVANGVPILQALNIVKETAGNRIVAAAVASVHESVKEGETIARPLKLAGIFPATMVGLVDVGEQTGALPEMLLKIADDYDEEVDNAVTAMTSLLEPIMIVCLAVVVGSIVIALFLPLIDACNGLDFNGRNGEE